MTPAKFIAIAFLAFAILTAATAIYAWTEMGRETGNGFANCAYVARKVNLAERVDSPKLVIVGGSNAAAGIDASGLGTELGVNAFNFSLFATFSPGFDLFQAQKVLHDGDAVLLAFEYLAYEYDAPTNALVDTVYSCGTDYWQSLDWPHRLMFVFAVRPQRFLSTLKFTGETSQSALHMVDTAIAPDGDLGNPFQAPTPEAGDHQPLVIRFRPRGAGTRQIADFARWAKAHGVRVFATWPNTLYFKEYENEPAFAEIARFYRKLGVPVIGRPTDAMVGSEYLAETIYHLTAPGIALRTERLHRALQANTSFTEWAQRRQPVITRE